MKMKIAVYLIAALLFAGWNAKAQVFISKGMVEYEVKSNVKKTMGNNFWEEAMKDAMSTFKTGYYKLLFDGQRSLYRFDRWDASTRIPEFFRRNDEDNKWYQDLGQNRFMMVKNMFGALFNMQDSVPRINWKIEHESRVIAGFNCRKAVGRINDSVYVFAFYTDEILMPGGPCSLNGLPGMILGVTIPRLYTSWIATKVEVNGVSFDELKAPELKKPMTAKAMVGIVDERTKEWVNNDDPESRKWRDTLLWTLML